MKFPSIFLVFLLNAGINLASPVSKREGSCPFGCKAGQLSSEKINIHLIPHSHDDVGWLQTYRDYYYGGGNFDSYQDAGVQYILNSTVSALKKNPDRTFIQVETAFFWKWWSHQPDDIKQDLKNLVNSGQLEMINGGWSMNDEAAAHYQSIIDQFTWGFRILTDTVGECGTPKIGWQIDPFGHSREHASLVKQMGFEGLVLGRIDFRDKINRKIMKNIDFSWTTSASLDDSSLFTTMFPNFYGYESGFCFDVTCHDDFTEEKVTKFAALMEIYSGFYKTNNIMIPMGQDFSYQVAETNYQKTDLLIEGFKDHPKFNVFYSTPSCYIQSVKDNIEENDLELTEKTDDFFPYASDTHAYWTGYYTSRPSSKRFERLGNNILQSVKQLTTFSRIQGNEYDSLINGLRTAMGIFQHHDAITGTEKQKVADDYARLLYAGIKYAETPIGAIVGQLLQQDPTQNLDLNLSMCLLANVSQCDVSQNDKFLVAIYNPLSTSENVYVRIPVPGSNYKITGPDGEEVFDIFENIHSFDYLKATPASYNLVFLASQVPALGVKVYYVENIADGTSVVNSYKEFTDTADQVFGTDNTNFAINGATGRLSTVQINNISREVQQEFYYYNGSNSALNTPINRASGAYVFEPTTDQAAPITDSYLGFKFAKGSLVEEAIQYVDEEITQIIRVYKATDEPYIEFDWLIGNLIVSNYGKEVITRFNIEGLNNNGTFYTDSNGREQIKRQLNTRSDYSYNPSEEPVTSNYYPVPSKISIRDDDLSVAVLTDRSQGGSSLENGQIELMVHRRLVRDDGFGVNEVLTEVQFDTGLYIRGSHYLTFNSPSSTGLEKTLANRKLLAPLMFLADATIESLDSLEKVQDLIKLEFSGLKSSLPANVKVLTLEPWRDSYILRLEHMIEKDEDKDLSAPVTLDLTDLFTLFKITNIKETTLGANIDLDGAIDLSAVTLNPMQIRTFVIETDQNNDGGLVINDGTETGDEPDPEEADTPKNSSEYYYGSVSPISILIAFCFSWLV